MELMRASSQWMTRPADERYTTLEELHQAVAERRDESWTMQVPANELQLKGSSSEKGIVVTAYDPSVGHQREVNPTNWAFGMLSQYAKAPASYLRTLPPELAAVNIQYGLDHMPLRKDALVLGQTNGANILRSMTSTSYGRIWDQQVVEAVQNVNHDGRWQVPASSYTTTNPKRATTLYASDRDVFIFLVDPDNAIELGDERLHRGFFTWNSEVGAATFGLTTFLYRSICDNRIVWGATDVKELRIRHTGGAPERFAYEGAQYLSRYAEESSASLVEGIKKAQAFEIKDAEKPGNGWEKWLTDRGFTATQAKNGVEAAKAEEGEARSLWDIVNGLTASARQIQHTDERVKLESQAGKLMQYAS